MRSYSEKVHVENWNSHIYSRGRRIDIKLLMKEECLILFFLLIFSCFP